MFHEALQMVHNNNRIKTKSMNTSHNNNNNKLGNSTHSINNMSSQRSLTFGSSVAIHKLRESKWFTHVEMKIFCSVVESGFIVEKRHDKDEHEDKHQWGIAWWKTGYEKSKNKDYLSVYTIVLEKEKYKVKLVSLTEFWTENTNIRINNHDDKNNTPNYETEIQKQIHSAMKNKHLNWHNTQHFAHWCRYTKPSQRLAQISETIKGNSVGVTAGLLMIKRKIKRPTS